MQEYVKERKLAFGLLHGALKKNIIPKTTSRTDVNAMVRSIMVVSGIEQRIHSACIDTKSAARDQRMRHGIVYRQMVREALGRLARSGDVLINDTMYLTRLANEVAKAAVQPFTFIDEAEIANRRLQTVQDSMKTKVKCTKCNGAAVVYEKQERSSDEGATVYHQCVNPDCKYLLRIA